MRISLWLALPLVVTGCPGKDDTGETADTGETGETGTPASISIRVLNPGERGTPPVEGITIAADTVAGQRLEAVTDAHGRAELEVDVADLAAVVAHRDGWSFHVVSGAAAVAFGGELQLWAWPLVSVNANVPPEVTLSGALLHKPMPDDWVYVETSVDAAFTDQGADTYELAIPTGQAFDVVAADWGVISEAERIVDHDLKSLVWVEHAAVTEDTVLDLDFAAPAATVDVMGSIAAPAHEGLATHGRLDIRVFGSTTLGYAYGTSPLEDNSAYHFALRYIDRPVETLVTYVALTDAAGDFSEAYLEGAVPVEGAQDIGLLAPPHRIAPVGEGPFDWSEPVSWTPPEQGQLDGLLIAYFSGASQVGLVYVAPDESSYALPDLPSTSTFLVDGALDAALSLCGSTDSDVNCELWAQEASFEVIPPLGAD